MPNKRCENVADTFGEKKCRVLITGADSYVGSAVESWLQSIPERYCVTVLDVIDDKWRAVDFSAYDVVFHVAAIVHRRSSRAKKEFSLYYGINTKLTEEIAKKAKDSNVRQFIFMSSMSVYSACKEKYISENTEPKAKEPYGRSKLMAEEVLKKMQTDEFQVVLLRAPMIYGDGCKGNYPRLVKLAKVCCIFPQIENKRSMLHIDGLCRFVQLMIDNRESGVFFPQDKEYINTSNLVRRIARENNHKIWMVPGLTGIIKLTYWIPCGIGTTMKKLFDDYVYEQEISKYIDEY